MFERLLAYWPLITAGALAVVSVFNIGYFLIVGLHFIGVMDLSNIIYSVGLVFALLVVPLVTLPEDLHERIRDSAARPDAARRFNRMRNIAVTVIFVCFAAGMTVHSRPYISMMSLFALTFLAIYVVAIFYCYAMWVNTGTMPARSIFTMIAFGVFTVFWVGGAVAYHEAFGTRTLYKVVTKDSMLENVRLVRSSSSGFIIARDKQIIYVPAGELKSITQTTPVD